MCFRAKHEDIFNNEKTLSQELLDMIEYCENNNKIAFFEILHKYEKY